MINTILSWLGQFATIKIGINIDWITHHEDIPKPLALV
jgi:hypothetical protein